MLKLAFNLEWTIHINNKFWLEISKLKLIFCRNVVAATTTIQNFF